MREFFENEGSCRCHFPALALSLNIEQLAGGRATQTPVASNQGSGQILLKVLYMPSSHALPSTIMPPAKLLGAQLLPGAAPRGRIEPSHMPSTTHAWTRLHPRILGYFTEPHAPSHTTLQGNLHKTSDTTNFANTLLSYSQVIHWAFPLRADLPVSH